MSETKDEELQRLRRFRERVFEAIDEYIDYWGAGTNQCEILRELKAVLREHQ
jgi:hypothetical protein